MDPILLIPLVLFILILVPVALFVFFKTKGNSSSDQNKPKTTHAASNSSSKNPGVSSIASFLVEESDQNPLDEETIAKLDPSLFEYQIQNYIKSFLVKVTGIRELRQQPTPTDSTIHFDLDISEFKDKIYYQTACDIGVFPENDDQSVLDAAAYLGVDLNQIITFKPNPNARNSSAKLPFPTPSSVGVVLKKYIDLSGMIKKSSLKDLASLAQDQAVSKE